MAAICTSASTRMAARSHPGSSPLTRICRCCIADKLGDHFGDHTLRAVMNDLRICARLGGPQTGGVDDVLVLAAMLLVIVGEQPVRADSDGPQLARRLADVLIAVLEPTRPVH